MNRKLITYRNCSRGGVSAVIRGRAADEPETHFDALFELDKGGRQVFEDLPNVSVRIARKGNLKSLVNYALKERVYSEVSIFSDPELANEISVPDITMLVYELHSGSFQTVERELAKLEQSRVDVFRMPSEHSRFNIEPMIKTRYARRIEVSPNLINPTIFNTSPKAPQYTFPDDVIPIIWVGRFDKGKGPKYLVRTLAQLPSEYHAYMIVSLETEPGPASDVLGEADALGVSHRLHLRSNLSQQTVAAMYRGAAASGGCLASTSLLESFGYLFSEAPACGLTVYAFDLPVIHEHTDYQALIHVVPPGDVTALSRMVQRHGAPSPSATGHLRN